MQKSRNKTSNSDDGSNGMSQEEQAALEPVFFRIDDPEEEKRINLYRTKYQEFRTGKAFGAKGEVNNTLTVADSSACLVVPPFIAKLSGMLENPAHEPYITWNDSGDTVIVRNLQEFANVVIPKYFKHKNFASFLRQLNMYHFSTTKQEHNWREFKNPLFRKGQTHLHKQIKRKNNPTLANGGSKGTKTRSKRSKSINGNNSIPNSQQQLLKKANKLIAEDVTSLWETLKETRLQLKEMQDAMMEQEKVIRSMQNYIESQANPRKRSRSEIDSGRENGSNYSFDFVMPPLHCKNLGIDNKPISPHSKQDMDANGTDIFADMVFD